MSYAEEHVRWEGLANNQMRLWNEKEKDGQSSKPHTITRWDKAFITISRAYGARGFRIGQLVATKLNWEIYSKNIVEHIAETAKLRDQIISDFDEKKRLANLSQMIFDPSAYTADKYYRHLVQVILTLADHGRAVILGRGANFITNRNKGLHVRVTASLESRIKRYEEKERVSYRDARKKVVSMDRERADFIRHYFHQDIDDPTQYELVINVEELTNEQVADMIIHALEIKLSEKRPE